MDKAKLVSLLFDSGTQKVVGTPKRHEAFRKIPSKSLIHMYTTEAIFSMKLKNTVTCNSRARYGRILLQR